ncbi:MAG: hypothetical protein KJZ72_19560 [Anaerolineales bacterium]|nr:hypothetical protein [Anaerolineales bacterium]
MQAQEKPTKFGLISSIFAIFISVLWFVYIVILMIYTQREVTSIDVNSAFIAVILVYGGSLFMTVLTFLFTIAGMILSVLSLRKGEPKRFFAIAGFVIHFLLLLPYCIGCLTFFIPLNS